MYGKYLPPRRFGLFAALALLACTGGCGTNLDNVLIQTARAAGRTTLDVILTELVNALAEQLRDGQGDTNGEPMDGGDGNGGDGGSTNGDLSGLTGDAANGETVYANNNCAGCHCADASGGCGLSAPAVMGVSRDMLNDYLRGSAPHPVRANLSDQEIVDLEAYLASL